MSWFPHLENRNWFLNRQLSLKCQLLWIIIEAGFFPNIWAWEVSRLVYASAVTGEQDSCSPPNSWKRDSWGLLCSSEFLFSRGRALGNKWHLRDNQRHSVFRRDLEEPYDSTCNGSCGCKSGEWQAAPGWFWIPAYKTMLLIWLSDGLRHRETRACFFGAEGAHASAFPGQLGEVCNLGKVTSVYAHV